MLRNKVLILALLFLVFSFNIAHSKETVPVKQAQDKYVENVSKKKALYYYLRSIIPPNPHIPPIKNYSLFSGHYLKFFEEKHPKIYPGTIIESNYKLYDISKESQPVLIHVGFPAYLEKQESGFDEELETYLDFNITAVADNLYTLDFKQTDNASEANIFLLPVKPHDLIVIANPDVGVRYSFNKQEYVGLLKDLKNVFFNFDTFSLNDDGLEGALIKNKDGRVLASLCPIDITKQNNEESIFYCITQSLGLPGFFKTFPEFNERTITWANRLSCVHQSEEINPKDNFYDIDVSEKTIEKCY